MDEFNGQKGKAVFRKRNNQERTKKQTAKAFRGADTNGDFSLDVTEI